MAAASPFLALLRTLKKFYGRPMPPKLKGALEIVLWENCAYLAADDRRAAAFALLKKTVGLKPRQILDADPSLLLEVGRFGIVPYESTKKLRLIAEIAHYTFKDDVDSVLDLPLKQARKELHRFPSIGDHPPHHQGQGRITPIPRARASQPTMARPLSLCFLPSTIDRRLLEVSSRASAD